MAYTLVTWIAAAYAVCTVFGWLKPDKIHQATAWAMVAVLVGKNYL
ncbi:hypothetical protein [Anaerotalea alkaliphila]|uniref:Uncharacterized protein n=1 Tax=Anaerotalea alkaliphila TaxID=2662126 RepID=A0A7X5HXJ0_9FIRM|nr:hypothetical protein [Anaerotalea alkaliphila]NDL68502.1 hypothetical protein [Anaerotalea alkaliphila]